MTTAHIIGYLLAFLAGAFFGGRVLGALGLRGGGGKGSAG